MTCALSHQTLSPPIVSDWSGKLFNKDAVLESLIAGNGEKLEDSTSKDRQVEDVRVGSLRDVIEVKFQLEGTSDQNEDRGNSTRWVCPITNKALGPGTKAVYLVPCGHAFSENALKELAGNSCLQVCHQSSMKKLKSDFTSVMSLSLPTMLCRSCPCYQRIDFG